MKDSYVADKASLVPQRRPPPSSVFLYGIFGEKILLPFFKSFYGSRAKYNSLEFTRNSPVHADCDRIEIAYVRHTTYDVPSVQTNTRTPSERGFKKNTIT